MVSIDEQKISVPGHTEIYAPNATDRYEAELKEVRRENLKLKAELSRAQEERDILKKAAAYFAKNPE